MTNPRLVVYSAKSYDRAAFDAALGREPPLDVDYYDVRLTPATASLAAGADAVCAFVNDDLGAVVLDALDTRGVKVVAMRCAGYNNVDVEHARAIGMPIVRVPAYSPNAVAEHTLAMILSLNRHIHRAYNRVRDGNFSLEGLVGFDVAGKTAAVIGTGKIGAIVARLLWHLRCDVLAVDPYRDDHLVELGVEYVELDDAIEAADIITLNCPLTPETYHLIDAAAVARMRLGVMLVNTGRGALVNTGAVIEGLKSGQIGSVALDVYEEEDELFFEDRSEELLLDDTFARMLTFPNVLITAHQAFLTHEALDAIATTTIDNVVTVVKGQECTNAV